MTKITAKEFDEKFDNGEDISEYLDFSKSESISDFMVKKNKRVNIDFPKWMVRSLDAEAEHIGVSRQAIIKTWLAEKLNQRATPK
jgi:hypothetical protein